MHSIKMVCSSTEVKPQTISVFILSCDYFPARVIWAAACASFVIRAAPALMLMLFFFGIVKFHRAYIVVLSIIHVVDGTVVNTT